MSQIQKWGKCSLKYRRDPFRDEALKPGKMLTTVTLMLANYKTFGAKATPTAASWAPGFKLAGLGVCSV